MFLVSVVVGGVEYVMFFVRVLDRIYCVNVNDVWVIVVNNDLVNVVSFFKVYQFLGVVIIVVVVEVLFGIMIVVWVIFFGIYLNFVGVVLVYFDGIDSLQWLFIKNGFLVDVVVGVFLYVFGSVIYVDDVGVVEVYINGCYLVVYIRGVNIVGRECFKMFLCR